jgi:hypothetical protein
MVNLHDELVQAVNTSPLLAGICMLILNVGSRYVNLGLRPEQEKMVTENLARELLLFAICFMGTKDVMLSIVLTGSFIILADYVFNAKSTYCVAPEYLRRLERSIDQDKDGLISETEIKKAIMSLTRSRK